MEARAGIEPAIVVLQTTALPLGDLAVPGQFQAVRERKIGTGDEDVNRLGRIGRSHQ